MKRVRSHGVSPSPVLKVSKARLVSTISDRHHHESSLFDKVPTKVQTSLENNKHLKVTKIICDCAYQRDFGSFSM